MAIKITSHLFFLTVLWAFVVPAFAMDLDYLLDCAAFPITKLSAGSAVRVKYKGEYYEGFVTRSGMGSVKGNTVLSGYQVSFITPGGLKTKTVTKSWGEILPSNSSENFLVGQFVGFYSDSKKSVDVGQVIGLARNKNNEPLYEVRFSDGNSRHFLAKSLRGTTKGVFQSKAVEAQRDPYWENVVPNPGPPSAPSSIQSHEFLVIGRPESIESFGPKIGGAVQMAPGKSANEDSIYVVQKSNGTIELGAIDGMGGYAGGDQASKIATQRIAAGIARGESLSQSIVSIPAEYQRNSLNPKAGVVLVTASIHANEVIFHSVGDAKGAVFNSGGSLKTQTPERSLGAYQQELFGTAFEHRDRQKTNGAVTSNGVFMVDQRDRRYTDTAAIDQTHARLKQGDWVVLASDGVWDNLQNPEIGKILSQKGITAFEATRQIKNAVSRKGIKVDDISIVVYQH